MAQHKEESSLTGDDEIWLPELFFSMQMAIQRFFYDAQLHTIGNGFFGRKEKVGLTNKECNTLLLFYLIV